MLAVRLTGAVLKIWLSGMLTIGRPDFARTRCRDRTAEQSASTGRSCVRDGDNGRRLAGYADRLRGVAASPPLWPLTEAAVASVIGAEVGLRVSCRC